MKPLVHMLAGAAVALALAAGPVAAQGRERPAGAAGGGAAGGGSGVRTGGQGAGGMGGSGGGSVAMPRDSSGGGSGSTYSPPPSTGSSSGSSSGGAVWRPRSGGNSGGNGGSTYIRELYGSPGDRAVPRGARPNPGRPASGEAVLRPNNLPGGRPGSGGEFNNYYLYNPYFLYGYGAFGLGYLYYDPFWWGYGPFGYGDGGYGDGGYGYGGYGYGGYGYGGYGYYGEGRMGRGSLKLKVEPKDAEVYVDGYYMGTVDDFDGTFQRMELEIGAHRVEIRAPGFMSISFDVRIESSDTVTYRGELQPVPKR